MEALSVGAAIGFLSGLVGFGGGILLAPWLLFRRRTSPLTAAGVSALFNLFNSAAGVVGARALVAGLPPVFALWLIAAAGGGWIGATIGSRYLPGGILRLVLSALLAVAGGNCCWARITFPRRWACSSTYPIAIPYAC